MNKTRWDRLGGHPLRLDDFHLDQGATREAISKTLSGLTGGNPCIIEGCVFTNPAVNTMAWTAGYLFANDEFFFLPAGNIIWPGAPSSYGNVRFRVGVNSFFTNGNPVVYANNSQQNVHEIRQARILVNTVGLPPDNLDPRIFRRLPEAILQQMPGPAISVALSIVDLLNRLRTETDVWHVVGNAITGLGTTLLNGFTSIGQPTVPPIAFRKDPGGWVHLRGITTKNTGTATASHIFTLPAGYRPNISYHLSTSRANTWTNFGGLAPLIVEINAAGEVHARGGMTTTGILCILNGLSFPTN